MFKTLVNAFRDRDIRKRIFLTLGMLFLFRLGSFIPLPGLDAASLQPNIGGESGGEQEMNLLTMLNVMTGGSWSQGTLFTLGILPFINSFIIVQLLSLIIPKLAEWTKGGDEERNKVTQITRYIAIVLAIVQGIGIVISWNNAQAVMPTFGSKVLTMVFVIIMLTAGSTICMWIGERITEYGIGNGTSLLIFVGILSSAGSDLLNAITSMGNNNILAWNFVGFILFMGLIFLFIVFVDLSERRIPVIYAKRVVGNKQMGGQSSYIPMKVNASGVMPIIFASSILMFPQMIANFWPTSEFTKWWTQYMGVGTWVYMIAMVLLIIFFAYFYAQIQFNPVEVAKNIQQYGGMITGIRPGKPTGEYLQKINNRITLFGALFLGFISLVPSVVFKYLGEDLSLTNAFSATGLLIIVSVALELNKQLESQIMMKHYKGFLK